MSVRRSDRGVALLEVLIALALLSIGGLATVAMVDSAVRAQSDMSKRERAVQTASRVLTALTLLKPGELAQRIGNHPLGEFVVSISRPEPTLYRIALADAGTMDVEVVATVVYRP